VGLDARKRRPQPGLQDLRRVPRSTRPAPASRPPA
jgi:hypothetical protein